MKNNKFYSLASIAFLCFCLSFLMSSCSDDPMPEITKLEVCDSAFSKTEGCDFHHPIIDRTSPVITASITTNDLERSNSYEFNVYMVENGERTFVIGSGLGLISDITTADDFTSTGLLLGYTWPLPAGNVWQPGNFIVEVKVNTVPELITSVDLVIE